MRQGRRLGIVALGWCALSAAVLSVSATASGAPGAGNPASNATLAASVNGAADPNGTIKAELEALAPDSPLVTSAAVGAPAAAGISVTPATDLAPGQLVQVTGSGFTSGGPQPGVVLIECATPVSSASTCDYGTYRPVALDETGAFDVAEYEVHRTIRSEGADEPIACDDAAGACVIAAFARPSYSLAATAPLSFDPDIPRPEPTVAVTPSTDLLDGAQVGVTGSGFVPGRFLAVSQCAVGGSCGRYVSGPTQVDATGAFSATLTVRLRAVLAESATNCVAVACEIRVMDEADAEYDAAAPITFDPEQPLPPDPSITVSPATDLAHGQSVHIEGAGFEPNGYLEVTECRVDDPRYCGEYLGYADIGTDGTFALDAPVTRLTRSSDGTTTEIVDCAREACAVAVYQYAGGGAFRVVAPIAFADDVAPPAPPVVTADPGTDLAYRTTVAVNGTGFSPGAEVSAAFCVRSAVDGRCSSYTGSTSDSEGRVSLSVAAQRVVLGYSGTVLDCLDAGVECAIELDGRFGFEHTVVPLAFDPDAPVPPPPTATVTPDEDLGWRQTVSVAGSGFAPGPKQVAQCVEITVEEEGEEYTYTDCDGYSQLTADASGVLGGEFTVHRKIREQFPNPLDCATNPDPCFLRVGDPYNSFGDYVDVPLGFDPDSQPPPPPVVTVSPRSHLADEQVIAVRGTGFTPGASLGMSQCRAGATAIADLCDVTRVRVVTADANGAFETIAAVRSAFVAPVGATDCTAAPASCALVVSNGQQFGELSQAPLRFDAPELDLHSRSRTEGTGHDPTHTHVMMDLSEPNASPITVAWVAHGITATPGSDFTTTRGRTTIPAGATEAEIPLELVADSTDEPDESFMVEVTSAPGTKVVDPDAVFTIRDDDRRPYVGIVDGRAREGDPFAYAEVLLSAPSGKTVTVEYRTRHDTTTPGADYTTKQSRLIFRPGETRHLVRIALVDDRIDEATERLFVDIEAAEHARILRSRATVTVTDND